MRYNFLNTSVSNLYTKPSSKAEVSSQIIYGEKFRILSKQKSTREISHFSHVINTWNNVFKETFSCDKGVDCAELKKVCEILVEKIQKNRITW